MAPTSREFGPGRWREWRHRSGAAHLSVGEGFVDTQRAALRVC
jgi:hypothetical protein